MVGLFGLPVFIHNTCNIGSGYGEAPDPSTSGHYFVIRIPSGDYSAIVIGVVITQCDVTFSWHVVSNLQFGVYLSPVVVWAMGALII